MSKSLCLAISLLLVSPLCNAEIFKCTKAGRTVYQNFPCPIDSIGSEATQPPPVAPAAPRVPVEANRNAKAADAADKPVAAADHGLTFGMAADEVRAIWGEPMAIIKTGQETGEVEIWKYDGNRAVGFNRKGIVATVTPSQSP